MPAHCSWLIIIRPLPCVGMLFLGPTWCYWAVDGGSNTRFCTRVSKGCWIPSWRRRKRRSVVFVSPATITTAAKIEALSVCQRMITPPPYSALYCCSIPTGISILCPVYIPPRCCIVWHASAKRDASSANRLWIVKGKLWKGDGNEVNVRAQGENPGTVSIFSVAAGNDKAPSSSNNTFGRLGRKEKIESLIDP